MPYKENLLVKSILKPFQVMSKKDYYNTDIQDIPLWINHEYLTFRSSAEMLEWAADDKVNFNLSDKVYDAMVDCLENKIISLIVATIRIDDGTQIDVLIRTENFQKILSAYIKRLIDAERYEKLAVIKEQIQKYGLEIS